MNIAIIDNGTTLLDKLKSLIPGEEFVYSNACDDLECEEFDLVVLSGTSRGPLYGNEDVYKKEIELIRSRNKLTVGICFGCELIAHAYGMELEEMEQQEKGLREYMVLSKKAIFGGRDTFEAYENHKWRIKQVNEPFETLATSVHGPAVIKHRELPIFGLQFHPENLVEESFGDDIFRNLIRP